MRALLIALVLVFSACTDTTLADDTAYRRLGDQYTSYDQCIADGDFNPCYQTLTLCANGRVFMDLENAPQEGSYQLANDTAVAKFTTRTVVFDLSHATSTQLPGVHPWEFITPIFYGCDVK
jgi:hypothetical protein